ncbi:MAG: DUF5696 domain-containing protein [Oscillospiraceae bacterium]|nr:DUF5696 domain-containing protein [Oscillospiraceae bacterium]
MQRFLVKTIPIILLLSLLLSLASCDAGGDVFEQVSPYRAPGAGTALELDGLSKVAQNSKYELWLDSDICAFEIRSGSGVIWRSLPENYENPDWAHNMLIPNLASLLTVTALDASLARQDLHSYEHCVQTDNVKYEAITDGVRIIFRYQRQGLTIPVDITLTDDGFMVSVAPGDIVETGDFIVNQLMLMPYFNSGSSDDDGFLFYPDGSGVISNYKTDYNNPADIVYSVYGFDNGIGTVEAISNIQGYRMPVFGAKTNDAAYLAVIEGDSSFISSVVTGVMRSNNRYFRNGVIFTYRDVGRVALRDNQTTVSTNYTIPSPITATVPMSVRYLLLEGNEINYNDMAFAYRDYLERSGVLTERTVASRNAHLTLAGAVKRPSSFIGIPMEREITLTTFEQAQVIVSALKDIGLEQMSIMYKGAHAGGYNSQWTRDYRFNRSLGGSKGWEKLLESLEKEGNSAFLMGEILQVYKTGRGFSASNSAARTTGGGLNFQYDYYIQDGTRNAYARRWYLLSPNQWESALKGVRENKHMSLEDAGRLVYSDYNQNSPVFRDRTGPALVQALKKDEGRLALSYGNAYVWELMPVLYDVPLGASGFFLECEEVPFYQLVIHGYIEYSGTAMNLSPDKQTALLRSIEYGALPHYFGTYAESSLLRNTVLEGMFASQFLDWIDIAAEQTSQIGDLYKQISGQHMTGHEKISDGIYQTTYENGIVVTVDYNTRTFEVR